MGWEALRHWGECTTLEQLAGGVRNDVRLVEIDGRRGVARLGSRSTADLEWETNLLGYLHEEGLGVPALWPTLDGRVHVDGVVVMDFVSGRPPESADEWQMVASYLRRLHALTTDWEQRPGWASSVELLTRVSGTSIDLTAMPAEAVARCRKAWERLAGHPRVVVHGDPNPNNIRIEGDGVVLIDWDESRVDVAALDLALPSNAAALSEEDLRIAAQASSAWEAAVCWAAEHDYAVHRLAEVAS